MNKVKITKREIVIFSIVSIIFLLIPFIAALQQVHGFATRTTAKAKALAAGAKAGPLRDQLDAVEPLSAFGVTAAGVALRARGARCAAGLAAVLAAVFEGALAEGLCDSF